MKHGTASAYNKGCRCDLCKEHKRAAHKAYRERNREKELARDKRNREADPDYIKRWRAANPERVRAYRRRWSAANPKKVAAKNKRWAQANADRLRIYQSEWKKTPRGRIYNQNLQHMRRGVSYTPEGRDYAIVLAADPCAYCGNPSDTIDHITAIGNGGDGEWTNLTPACRSCNARKRTRSLLNFLQELAA